MYLGNRRFLSMNHPVRKKGKHFKDKADHRCKPRNRTGKDVFEMVKDVKVVFGKVQGGQPVPKDAAGHAPMWKKSIFWELPYWQARGPECDRRHAPNKECLCEPSRIHGCIW